MTRRNGTKLLMAGLTPSCLGIPRSRLEIARPPKRSLEFYDLTFNLWAALSSFQDDVVGIFALLLQLVLRSIQPYGIRELLFLERLDHPVIDTGAKMLNPCPEFVRGA
jgi:hypothetical protein